jgi:transposase-like protein
MVRHDLSEKVQVLQRYQSGEPVVRLCREFGISRTLFYRWLNRYKASGGRVAAMDKLRPAGLEHWRFVNVSDILLELISEHPEYSLSQLSARLSERLGKRLLGTHGIYTRLKHWGLSRYEDRVKWVAKKRNKG